MATYATTTDYEAYVEGWVTDDAAALERTLQRSEEDIDDVITGDYLTATGRKLDPTSLNFGVARARYLKRATCAQAEYRLLMGEEFFTQAQYDSVSGPDFSASGKRPRLGPKAISELQRGRLMQTKGRARP